MFSDYIIFYFVKIQESTCVNGNEKKSYRNSKALCNKKNDSREPMLLSWINPPSEHKFPLENELDNRAKTNKRWRTLILSTFTRHTFSWTLSHQVHIQNKKGLTKTKHYCIVSNYYKTISWNYDKIIIKTRTVWYNGIWPLTYVYNIPLKLNGLKSSPWKIKFGGFLWNRTLIRRRIRRCVNSFWSVSPTLIRIVILIKNSVSRWKEKKQGTMPVLINKVVT